MKKKLLVLFSFTALLGTLVGCGETTVSFKPSSSSRSVFVPTQDPTDYYRPAPREDDDNDYVKLFCEVMNTNGYITANGSERSAAHFDYQLPDVTDITPFSVSDQISGLRVMKLLGSSAYFFFPDTRTIYECPHAHGNIIDQIGVVDYDNNGNKDVVYWAINEETYRENKYYLCLYDRREGKIGCITTFDKTAETDYVFSIEGNSFYINGKEVYYKDGYFICDGWFKVAKPKNL